MVRLCYLELDQFAVAVRSPTGGLFEQPGHVTLVGKSGFCSQCGQTDLGVSQAG